MKLNKNVLGLAVAVVGLTLAAQVPGVSADSRGDHHGDHTPIVVGSVAISEAQAITIAQGQLAGTVVKTRLKMVGGVAVWKVRILSTDGLQRGDFRIDANTGAVLKSAIKPVGAKHDDQATEHNGTETEMHGAEGSHGHEGHGSGR